MPHAASGWTVEMVRALPEDGQRHEVIDGELFVTPSPTWRHQDAVTQLAAQLRNYASGRRIGLVLVAPADVAYSATTSVQPDVLVAPFVAGRPPRDSAEAGGLLLAIEVRSPSTARLDREVKRRLYQREAVPEYWLVDLDAELIERWRPGDMRPEILVDRIEWRPLDTSESFVLDLPAFFAGLAG